MNRKEIDSKIRKVKNTKFKIEKVEYDKNFIVYYVKIYYKRTMFECYEWLDMGGVRRYDDSGKIYWGLIHANIYKTPLMSEKEAYEFIEIYKQQRIESILKLEGISDTFAYFRKNKFDKIK